MYANIAYLVDKNAFIEEVIKARESLGLLKPLSYEAAQDWQHRNIREINLKLLSQAEKELFNQKFRLDNKIAFIKDKFRLSQNYTEVVRYSILAGKVTDKECSWSPFCVEYPFPEEFIEAELDTEQSMVAIFVNPETKRDQVEKLFDTKVKELFKKINNKKVPTRASSNIKRDREWYWQVQEGKSFQEIANSSIADTARNRDVVFKAVDQYRKKLGVES